MNYKDVRTRGATQEEINLVKKNIQFDYQYLNEVLFNNARYDYFITAWMMKIEFNDGTTRPVIIYFIKYSNDIYLFADEYGLREHLPTDADWINDPGLQNIWRYFRDKKNLRMYAYFKLTQTPKTEINNPNSKIIKGDNFTISNKMYTLMDFKSGLAEPKTKSSIEVLVESFCISKEMMHNHVVLYQERYHNDEILFKNLDLKIPNFDWYDMDSGVKQLKTTRKDLIKKLGLEYFQQ